MRVGIFADTHDHLDHIRMAVDFFNREECEVVLFAGDLVSTFSVPPLRKLQCPVVACFGDNEGNKIGLRGGFGIVGTIAEPPVPFVATDGTRFLIVHMLRQLRGVTDPFDIAVYAHTHRPRYHMDDQGRIFLNPGETSGWSFGTPTVSVLETETREYRSVPLLECAESGESSGIPASSP